MLIIPVPHCDFYVIFDIVLKPNYLHIFLLKAETSFPGRSRTLHKYKISWLVWWFFLQCQQLSEQLWHLCPIQDRKQQNARCSQPMKKYTICFRLINSAVENAVFSQALSHTNVFLVGYSIWTLIWLVLSQLSEFWRCNMDFLHFDSQV